MIRVIYNYFNFSLDLYAFFAHNRYMGETKINSGKVPDCEKGSFFQEQFAKDIAKILSSPSHMWKITPKREYRRTFTTTDDFLNGMESDRREKEEIQADLDAFKKWRAGK